MTIIFRTLILIILLSATSVLALITGGCTSVPWDAGQSSQDNNGQDVIELKFAAVGVKQGPLAEGIIRWTQRLTEASGGRLKFIYYWGGSLAKAGQTYVATESGICDLGHLGLTQEPARFPLNSISDIPLMQYGDTHRATDINWELINRIPELSAEYRNVKLLFIWVGIPTELHTINRPVSVPSEMAGIKINADGVRSTVMELVGATPITQTPPDWYTSLSTGLSEGIAMGWVPFYTWGCVPLTNYHTNFGTASLGMSKQMVIMNMDSWNRLAPDLQKIMEDLGQEAAQDILELEEIRANQGKAEARKLGHTFIETTPEELQAWFEAIKPIHDRWISENEARGLPGKAIYEETRMLIEEGEI